MPEAMWLTFQSELSPNAVWSLHKVDQDVSVFDEARIGARTIHAVAGTIDCRDGERRFTVDAFDSPMIALGKRSPLNVSLEFPNLTGGMNICLFNYASGTVYP
jgi:hypothetical protein